MRRWSKMVTLLLAAAMTLGLAGTVFAAEAGSAKYIDVPGWAQEYVERVTQEKLIDGKTETAFGANELMTRGDLVVALYRLAGPPANAKDAVNPFPDVKDDAAYKDAVVWAYANGIVGGRVDGSFDPEGSVKRQEIAKIINEFAAYQAGRDKLTTTGADKGKMSAFSDAADVADWAKNYMNWAVASELINGDDNQLLPLGYATRAQVSAILCRYIDDTSTGDASKDKPRNENNIGEDELLVVSFGTSYNDNRVETIGAIENAMEKAFPSHSVRRGFTSNIIIEHIYRRDGELIDDVAGALTRAKVNGVKNLLVQPTHLMNGYEYGDLVKELEEYADDFESIRIGAPLLTTEEDYAAVAKAMVDAAAQYDDGKTAICYMGHGTPADSNDVYARMQKILTDGGHTNYFVGTVEAHPDVQDVLKLIQAGKYERVVLRPMMIVAGDHANNDMADKNDPESWYSVFDAAGYEVMAELEGLGGLEAIQQLLVSHAEDARELDKTGIEVQPNPENGKGKTLSDGTYTIDVKSDSSMFKVIACELTVKDGVMTATLTLSGTGYDQMYVGTAAEAGKAGEGLIDYAADANGKYTFTVSVAELDEELAYAAHAVKSGKWFDRTLTFDAASAVAK